MTQKCSWLIGWIIQRVATWQLRNYPAERKQNTTTRTTWESIKTFKWIGIQLKKSSAAERIQRCHGNAPRPFNTSFHFDYNFKYCQLHWKPVDNGTFHHFQRELSVWFQVQVSKWSIIGRHGNTCSRDFHNEFSIDFFRICNSLKRELCWINYGLLIKRVENRNRFDFHG